MTDRSRGGPLGQAWLVLCLSLVFGTALAAVEIGLKPRIVQNKRDETYRQIPSLVPGASRPACTEVEINGRTVYEARASDGGQVGWVLPAYGQGFAGRIEVLVGLDLEATRITGIYILTQKETPGLGDSITDEQRFRRWFREQPTSKPLEVVKTEPDPGTGRIKALTGATISSDAVTEIVNLRVAAFKTELAALTARHRGV